MAAPEESALRELARQALEARDRAYAPYSRFRVGAAILGADGQVYTGCNVENAAYPACICAERGAVAKAVDAGTQRFVAVAVATDVSPPASPCGVCRQVLREFGDETVIVAVNPAGEERRWRLAELLPDGFSGQDLPSDAGEQKP